MVVDIAGPGIEPAMQIDDPDESLMFEIHRNPTATDAVVADYDGFTLRIQVMQCGLDLSHRNQFGAVDVADLELPRLAYIQQQRSWSGRRQVLRQLAWGQILHDRVLELEAFCLACPNQGRNMCLIQGFLPDPAIGIAGYQSRAHYRFLPNHHE